MRVYVAALAGSMALAAWSPASATCAREPEVTAFNMRALQSRLMVTALTCDMYDQYNSFVLRNRAALDGSRRTLVSYFGRAGGGERAFSNYDTELANVQSTDSTRRGSLFCSDMRPVFAEVLGLPNTAELQKYAVAKSLPQPRVVEACPAASSRPAAAAPRR
jgi:hypothetical protein